MKTINQRNKPLFDPLFDSNLSRYAEEESGKRRRCAHQATRAICQRIPHCKHVDQIFCLIILATSLMTHKYTEVGLKHTPFINVERGITE